MTWKYDPRSSRWQCSNQSAGELSPIAVVPCTSASAVAGFYLTRRLGKSPRTLPRLRWKVRSGLRRPAIASLPSFLSGRRGRGRMRRLVAHLASSSCDGAQSSSKLPLLHCSLLPVLSLASSFYGFSLFLRRELYRWGLLRVHRLPVPVVSVGNLTWGGNGKTPMTEFLARIYLEVGVAPLILTRGYAGGDEAAMLQRHLLNTPARIGLGAKRAAVASSMLEKYGRSFRDPFQQKTSSENAIGVIIIDDGFQHWSLARDLDVVMINGMMPWGNGKQVPRGTLREPLDALKRTDICVIHHADLVSDIQLKAIEEKILNIKKSLPIFYSRLAPQHFFDVQAPHTRIPLSAVHNTVLLCVSAIGFPSAFSHGIGKIGPLHVDRLDFVDHHIIQLEDIVLIGEQIQKMEDRFGIKPLVVVTEKDYDRDPKILKEIQESRVLVICSSLEIVPIGGQTLGKFKALLMDFHRNRNEKMDFS